MPESGFRPLGLSEPMYEALAKAQYQDPTPIQAGLIPRAMAGVDVLGQARTGTGKTAAFAIPILERLESRKASAGPQALVLVPTRELAVQVQGEVEKLSVGRNIVSIAVYGGKPIKGQMDKLRRGPQVIVGTPGRILDHIGRGSLILTGIRFIVLDEADRMLDIGFRPDIEKILRRCPTVRQTLLLSATVPPGVKKLAERYMREPESLDFSPGDISVETIEQRYFTCDTDKKFALLVKLLKRERPQQAIIFCRTKRRTDRVHQALVRQKLPYVGCIHGDLSQGQRDQAMSSFRSGRVRFLVATDVVGRGIDVTAISHIINYDIPAFCDDYVHRVGRTGRMGREGIAFTFVTPEEGYELTRIEMRINRMLERDEITGFETTSRAEAAPVRGINDEGEGEESADGPPAPAPQKPFGKARRRVRRAL